MRALGWTVAALALVAGAWFLLGQGPEDTASYDDVDEAGGSEEEAAPTLEAGGRAQPANAPSDGARGGGRILGVVRNEQGKPLAGVVVELRASRMTDVYGWHPGRQFEAARKPPDMSGPARATVTTDAQGRFSFDGLALRRSHQVRALPMGGRTGHARHVWLHQSPKEVDLVLRPGVPLAVRTVDGTGAPLAAWVHARRPAVPPPLAGQDQDDWSLSSIRTDAEGRLSLPAVPTGELEFGLYVPGRGSREGLLVTSPHEGEAVLAFEDPGGATLEGHVRDSAGAGIPRADVMVYVNPGGLLDWSRRSQRIARTDADSRYEIAGLPAGLLTSMQVSADGFLVLANATAQKPLAAAARTTVDVTLFRGGRVTGRVLDEAGAPIANARVAATLSRQVFSHSPPVRTLSDDQGRFELKEVPLGPARIAAWSPGHYTAFQDAGNSWWQATQAGAAFELRAEGEHKEVDVTLTPAATVRGIVTDAEGHPVAGASVTATGKHGRAVTHFEPAGLETHTDETGAFQLAGLPQGAWSFSATREGALSDAVVVQASPGVAPQPITITLRPAGRVAGRVEVDGAPPTEPVAVRLQAAPPRPGSSPRDTQTAKDGTFELRDVAEGEYEIFGIGLHGQIEGEHSKVSVRWGQAITDVVVRTQPMRTVRGLVVDEEGKPAAGVGIQLEYKSAAGTGTLGSSTGQDGRFAWQGVPEGEYFLTVGGMDPIAVEDEEEIRVVHRAGARFVIAGKVLAPDGTPVAQGMVIIFFVSPDGSMSGTGAQIAGGAFRHEGPRGKGTITLGVEGVTDALGRPIEARPFRLEKYEPDGKPLVIRLEAGLVLSGRVVDAEGAGVPGLPIQCRIKSDGRTRPMSFFGRQPLTTDADGRFEASGLEDAVYVLSVLVGGDWQKPAQVEARPGGEAVHFTLTRGIRIAGTVVDPEGNPAPDLMVSFRWRETSGGGNRQASTDADGAFVVGGLPAGAKGTLSVSPRAADSEWLQLTKKDVATGTEGLALQLEKGVFISGTVTGPEGEPVPSASVHAERGKGRERARHYGRGRSRGSSSFRLGPLRAGTWQLTAHASGEYASGDAVEVRAPAENVKLTVRRGHPIKGRLEGEGTQGFNVMFWHEDENGRRGGSGSGLNQDGSFTISNEVEHSGFLFATKKGDPRFGLLEDVSTKGGPYVVPLREGKRISGRVEGRDKVDERYRRMSHSVQARHEERGFSLSTTIAEDGTFEILGCPDGSYTITYQVANWRAARKGVSAGAGDVVLQVEDRSKR